MKQSADWRGPQFIHWWTGYGNSCMTYDGRRNDSQCSAKIEEVTCERCRQNYEAWRRASDSAGVADNETDSL